MSPNRIAALMVLSGMLMIGCEREEVPPAQRSPSRSGPVRAAADPAQSARVEAAWGKLSTAMASIQVAANDRKSLEMDIAEREISELEAMQATLPMDLNAKVKEARKLLELTRALARNRREDTPQPR